MFRENREISHSVALRHAVVLRKYVMFTKSISAYIAQGLTLRQTNGENP